MKNITYFMHKRPFYINIVRKAAYNGQKLLHHAQCIVFMTISNFKHQVLFRSAYFLKKYEYLQIKDTAEVQKSSKKKNTKPETVKIWQITDNKANLETMATKKQQENTQDDNIKIKEFFV